MPEAPRFLAWQIDETSGFDTAWVEVRGRQLIAEGRTAGQLPFPFWTAYEVHTGDNFVTARVVVESRWADGAARVDLRRDDGAPGPSTTSHVRTSPRRSTATSPGAR